jgi:tetratricopeptide (TPR) repeat protein
MKRNLSLWLGLLAFALLPALAQKTSAQATGKIHGEVINPSGAPQTNGTMSLSTDDGQTSKYTFEVSADGNYAGEAAPGTYTLVYREPKTPANRMVDSIKDVKIVAGQDLEQDDDMSRPEFIAKMTPEQKKQLEALKKANSQALKANTVIRQVNEDLKTVSQDQDDVDAAEQTATQTLGASATRASIAAKTDEIKTAKYKDIESLMTRDTAAIPDEAILWDKLGYAQGGLKEYDAAITSFKKALDLENAQKSPRAAFMALADAGLGEVYARTGKVPEANAAYDAVAKADPSMAALQYKNEAVIFYLQGNSTVAVAAADEAIQANPSDPVPYYIKGQGLIANATVDPKTQRIVLPPDCTAAYQKYLELAPNGQFAADVAAILEQAGEKINSSYRAGRH